MHGDPLFFNQIMLYKDIFHNLSEKKLSSLRSNLSRFTLGPMIQAVWSEVIKESVRNFEAQLEEDIDQDSGFVTEVTQPER